MRLIGTLPSETDARRLGDYLLSVGLPNQIEQMTDGNAWMLWIEHDDHVEQGQLRLREYQANPNDPKYDAASAVANAARKQMAAAAERRRAKHIDVRTSWSGLRIKATPVSIVLIIICLVIAALTIVPDLLQRNRPADEVPISTRVESALAFQPLSALADPDNPDLMRPDMGKGHLSTMFSSIEHGQVWRLVTPIFMHANILHLLFNLMWLYSLARMIEARKGSGFLIWLVLMSAVISCCGEAIWIVYTSGYGMFLGFSGVNYALFGYAWMKARFQPYEGVGVNQQTIGLMLGWLVLCMLGILGPVANAAHVTGLAAGVAVGYWATFRRKMASR